MTLVQQKECFSSHQLARGHLIEALLNIFIDIEFTGESMEFEDKFREWVGLMGVVSQEMNVHVYEVDTFCVYINSHIFNCH